MYGQYDHLRISKLKHEHSSMIAQITSNSPMVSCKHNDFLAPYLYKFTLVTLVYIRIFHKNKSE